MNDPSTSAERVLKSPGEHPRHLEFGRFRLDCLDRQLFHEGQPVALPPKTVELLVILVRRAGELVSKEALMAELWPDTFVEESNLTQHVFRLRKALANGTEYIENVPRRGYRFAAQVQAVDTPLQTKPALMPPPRKKWLAAAVTILAIASILAVGGVVLTRQRHQFSPTATQAFLKGRYHFAKRTVPDFRKAADYFQTAVEQEPRYALAWAGLADTYNFLGDVPRAKNAARRALEIDDTLVQAHTAIASASLFHDFDWPMAERHFRRAIELDPSHATAHHWYAFYLTSQGRFEEALMEIEIARRLEPVSLIINTDAGTILFYARRYDEAITRLHDVLKLDANFVQAHMILADAYCSAGDCESARRELESIPMKTFGAAIYAKLGDRQNSLRFTHESEQKYRSEERVQRGGAYAIALMHVALDDRDAAFTWLNTAMTNGDGNLAMMKVDPRFDPIREDPRFRALLLRMKL